MTEANEPALVRTKAGRVADASAAKDGGRPGALHHVNHGRALPASGRSHGRAPASWIRAVCRSSGVRLRPWPGRQRTRERPDARNRSPAGHTTRQASPAVIRPPCVRHFGRGPTACSARPRATRRPAPPACAPRAEPRNAAPASSSLRGDLHFTAAPGIPGPGASPAGPLPPGSGPPGIGTNGTGPYADSPWDCIGT